MWGLIVIIENNFHSYANARYSSLSLRIRSNKNTHVSYFYKICNNHANMIFLNPPSQESFFIT